MATTRGKGGTGKRGRAAQAEPAADEAPRARTRAPEDDISGVAEPAAAAAPRARGRRTAPGTGVAENDAPPAPAPRRRSAPGSGVAAGSAPAEKPAPARRGGKAAGAASAEPDAPKKRGGRRETYAETAARRRKEKQVDKLQADLRAFAVARPSGWNHDDWVAFLGDLGQRGHDTSDPESIGSRLEQERLAVVLGGVQGLGPKRVEALVERFRTLWSLRHAGADEVSGVPGMTRPLAERLVQELRQRYA